MLNNEILDQYNGVKNSVGLFDFSIEGKIIVKGPGRVDFINGLVSNDVENLENFSGCYAAFLDNNGKILSDCIVYKFDELLLINASIIGRNNIIEKLKNEALLGKAEVEDATLKYGMFSLQGSKSKELINNIFKSKIELQSQYQSIIIKSKNNKINETINNNHNNKKNIELDNNEIEIIITKNNRTTEEGYDIYVPASHYKEFKELIINNGKNYGLKMINNETYNILRLEAKIPLYGVDFNQNNILPEVTEKAISYEKGCYVGQEIVARVKNIAKGITAKKLRFLEIDGNDIPEKNAKIMADNNKVGYITSAAFSPNFNKVIGFGFLNKGFYEPNIEITINNCKATIKSIAL